MGFFTGISPAEKKKRIAAVVLGALAIVSLTYTFGGSLFSSGSRTRVSIETSPSPDASATVSDGTTQTVQSTVTEPNEDAINQDYLVTPVIYNGSTAASAPISGRNIFAFYEPPPPTPYVSPVPTEPPPPPPLQTPEPVVYPILIGYASPQSVYAGSGTFRLQVSGDRFTEDSQIIFNGRPLPTTYINSQQLVADVPASYITSPGTVFVSVRTPDGEKFSDQIAINVQAPPKPEFEYIGMIARRHYNNDTAYFQDKGSSEPFAARLNDVIKGRFRVVSISEREVEFQDTRLPFRHKLQLKRDEPGSSSSSSVTSSEPAISNPARVRRGNRVENSGGNDNRVDSNGNPCVPGIPCDLPRATPRPRPNNVPNNPTIDNLNPQKTKQNNEKRRP